MRPEEEAATKLFLDSLVILPVTQEIAEAAGYSPVFERRNMGSGRKAMEGKRWERRSWVAARSTPRGRAARPWRDYGNSRTSRSAWPIR